MSETVDDSSGGICDACLEFHTILRNRKLELCEKRVINGSQKVYLMRCFIFTFFSVENHLQSVTEGYEGPEFLIIDKNQLPIFYQYLGVWLQRYVIIQKCR